MRARGRVTLKFASFRPRGDQRRRTAKTEVEHHWRLADRKTGREPLIPTVREEKGIT